jgi:hypothetical protein
MDAEALRICAETKLVPNDSWAVLPSAWYEGWRHYAATLSPPYTSTSSAFGDPTLVHGDAHEDEAAAMDEPAQRPGPIDNSSLTDTLRLLLKANIVRVPISC